MKKLSKPVGGNALKQRLQIAGFGRPDCDGVIHDLVRLNTGVADAAPTLDDVQEESAALDLAGNLEKGLPPANEDYDDLMDQSQYRYQLERISHSWRGPHYAVDDDERAPKAREASRHKKNAEKHVHLKGDQSGFLSDEQDE
ncbi:hypothetical protein [Silvimonas soli]|uniref:hypothetical protein n=1 Tax=Silvimonas soli TaxID=2980100 RepID=UPI0024B379C4|nr:hypothetical protein [Silvimonas soli]